MNDSGRTKSVRAKRTERSGKRVKEQADWNERGGMKRRWNAAKWRKRGQKKAEERRGEDELGGERRTRLDEETKKERIGAAPDSAALIFNDILGRAGVPLMHGHYNMLLSPAPLLLLSFSLSHFLLQRTRACVYTVRDSPFAAFSIGWSSPLSCILRIKTS